MKWITRERPKIDRIACPWLIKRFIDSEPEFLYVPYQDVITISKKLNAIPFDIPEVKFTHYGTHCTSIASSKSTNTKTLQYTRSLTLLEGLILMGMNLPANVRVCGLLCRAGI
ncbi:MAG TPA: chromate resistance protein ChrB domain-containing protein [Flavitalea sp.]|nr:chromate resistance protein ChrB domain-containing protein [Flavitalea sp.]